MPELPEVETVCRELSAAITGSVILHVNVRRRKLRIALPDDFEEKLVNRTVTKVARRAKYILVHLEDGQILIIHLGMSGSMAVLTENPEIYRPHDHVLFQMTPQKTVIFHDPRRFGLMALTTHNQLPGHPLFMHLGLEPFDEELNALRLHTLLQHTASPIKTAIMDQNKIVGIGNIYASEALFRSRISPVRIANALTKKEAGILLENIRLVLQEAIKSGGSTLRDFKRSSGDKGYFQHHFSVYGKAGQPCEYCKKPIQLIKQAGRSTFFCGYCQH